MQIIFLVFLSALFLVLSFPRFDFYALVFFAFIPLFYSFFKIKNKQFIKTFFLGFLCGFLFYLWYLKWLPYTKRIGIMGYPALVVLSAYLSIYFGIFSYFCSLFFKQKKYILKIFAPSCLWVALEVIRGWGGGTLGFPWASLCYSQYLNLPLIQICEYTGMYAISFIIILTNIVIFFLIREKNKKLLIFFILFFGIYLFGYHKIEKEKKRYNYKSRKVAIIQGNLEKDTDWDFNYTNYTLSFYLDLSENVLKKNPDVQIIVWPETVVAYGDLEDVFLKELFVNIAKKLNRYFIVGCFDRNSEKKEYYNAGVVFSPDGNILGKYYKIQLVLFGETVPVVFRKLFKKINYDPWQDGGINLTKGRDFSVIETPLGKIGFNICFETIFPYISQKVVNRGAEVIVALVADSWFKSDTTYQHTSQAVFRAVENRRYLIRAADTGISCIISSYGKIEKNIKLGVSDTMVFDVRFINKKTFYTKHPNWFILFCFIICIISIYRIKLFKNN